jgi:hypothetical protein
MSGEFFYILDLSMCSLLFCDASRLIGYVWVSSGIFVAANIASAALAGFHVLMIDITMENHHL